MSQAKIGSAQINHDQRATLWVGISILAVLVTTAAVLFITRKQSFHGAVIEPPAPAAEINLTDDNGQPFRLSNLRGKVVLLYFGYTNCPNECPVTMAHLRLAVRLIGSRAENVQVVMVTTDPARDTPDAMKAFLDKFNSNFLGLPGTPDELAKVWKDYSVTVLDNGETHSSFTYVIDQNGNIRLTFLPNTLPEDIASDLKILLAEK